MWVALVVLGIGASAWAAQEHGSVAGATVSLMNDSDGHPLFSAQPPLVPGQPRSACLRVVATDAGPDDQVRLWAMDLSGSLAGQLQLGVYMGSGGGYGTCTGFTGSLIYHGTVAGLATLGPAGILSGWYPGHRSERSFRFVVTLSDDNAGQGAQAGASFGWRLDAQAGGSGPVAPSPAPTPVVTPSPSRGPSGGGPSAVSSPSGPSDHASHSGASRAPGSQASDSDSGSEPGHDAAPSTRPPVSAKPDVTLTQPIASQIGRTVIGVLARPQYSIGPLLVALGFLLVQHWVDARDPKLVHASRIWRELTVSFPLDYRPPGDSGDEGVPS